MKRPIALILIVLTLATLACSININLPNIQPKTGPTETFTVDQPIPSGSGVKNVNISMGAGSLELSSGATSLINGTIDYNISQWKPILTEDGDTITLKQENLDTIPGLHDVVNDWKLKLNEETPMDLHLAAGAYSGSVDLSGLRIQNLDITDGASQVTVNINTPNPEVMHSLTYKTGASQVKLYGLANANFEEMSFESGAGNYTLDFTGTLKRDATVTVKSGVSQITIIVPKGMAAKVVTTGALNNVNTEGDWAQRNGSYEMTGTGPTLSININMGVGNLNLFSR